MKKRINLHLICLALFTCSTLVYGDDVSGGSKEDAFQKLALRIKEERLNGKDCEKLGFVDQTGGKITVTGGTQMSFDNEYEGRQYQLELRNKEQADLTEMKIECRFFYVEESSWRTGSRKSKEEIKHIDSSFPYSVGAGARAKVKTDPFVMNSYAAPSGVYFSNGDAEVVESKPDGLWVRITYKTPDGEELQRDFCEPESLSSRVSWDGKSI